jgi:hypothetical protein
VTIVSISSPISPACYESFVLFSYMNSRCSERRHHRQLNGDGSSTAVRMNLQNTAKLTHSFPHSPQTHAHCRGGVNA